MTGLRPTRPVPADRAARYRAEGWWDTRGLADGIEAAAAERPDAVALIDNERTLSRGDVAAAHEGDPGGAKLPSLVKTLQYGV